MRLPAEPPPPNEFEVDGVYLPDGTLTTTADIAYVLNQEPGKLRIKDIKVWEVWGNMCGLLHTLGVHVGGVFVRIDLRVVCPAHLFIPPLPRPLSKPSS